MPPASADDCPALAVYPVPVQWLCAHMPHRDHSPYGQPSPHGYDCLVRREQSPGHLAALVLPIGREYHNHTAYQSHRKRRKSQRGKPFVSASRVLLPVQRQQTVKQDICHTVLAHQLQRFRGSVTIQQSDHIGVSGKTCALYLQVICHDDITVFVLQLFRRVFQQIPGFHGKTTDDLIFPALLTNLSQNIRIANQCH